MIHHKPQVTVVPASVERYQDIRDMLDPYLAELSVSADYPYLPLYWKEPTRFPYLILLGGATVGFALVRKLDERPTLQLAEFYILPGSRRANVGQAAAHKLFELLPGLWEIAVLPSNEGAKSFWRSTLGVPSNVAPSSNSIDACTVFDYDSKAKRHGARPGSKR